MQLGSPHSIRICFFAALLFAGDRARVVPGGKDCALTRGGGAPAAGTATSSSSTPAGKASLSPNGSFEALGVALGRSRIQEVRQNIIARGARPLIVERQEAGSCASR